MVCIGSSVHLILAGLGNSKIAPIILGIMLVIAGFYTKINTMVSDYTSSKAQDDLLK